MLTLRASPAAWLFFPFSHRSELGRVKHFPADSLKDRYNGGELQYLARTSEIDEHVQREIMNHRSLKHPNIVRFKEDLELLYLWLDWLFDLGAAEDDAFSCSCDDLMDSELGKFDGLGHTHVEVYRVADHGDEEEEDIDQDWIGLMVVMMNEVVMSILFPAALFLIFSIVNI